MIPGNISAMARAPPARARGLTALGDAPAGVGRGGQLVAVEDGDLLEVIGQRAGGGEAGDPGADDDGVAAER